MAAVARLPRNSGLQRPTRCRSAAGFRPRLANRGGEFCAFGTGLQISGLPPAVQSRLTAASNSGDPHISSSASDSRLSDTTRVRPASAAQLLGFGEKTPARRADLHRDQVLHLGRPSSPSKCNVSGLSRAASTGTFLELPPAFSRQISPSHSPKARPVLPGRQGPSPRCGSPSRSDLHASFGLEVSHLSVAGVSASSFNLPGIDADRTKGGSPSHSPDPYLRIFSLSEWLLQSPLFESIQASGALSPGALGDTTCLQGFWSTQSGTSALGVQSIRPRLDANYFKELQKLGDQCRLPMPIEGTPEELQCWAMKLVERYGTRRLAAFHRRFLLKEGQGPWTRRPSGSSSGSTKRAPRSERQVTPDQHLVESEPWRLPPGDPTGPGTLSVEVTKGEEASGTEADPSAVEETEVDRRPTASEERAQRYDEEANAKAVAVKPPKNKDGPKQPPPAKSRVKVEKLVPKEIVVTTEVLVEEHSFEDMGLFRVKTPDSKDDGPEPLLPRGLSDFESGDETNAAARAARAARQEDEYGLAPQFRRAVAHAWRPFTPEALAQARRAELVRLAETNHEVKAVIEGEELASREEKLQKAASREAPLGSTDHIMEEASSHVSSPTHQPSVYEELSVDQVVSMSLDDYFKHLAMRTVNKYSRRLRARSAKTVGRRESNQRWSQRADACERSLRSLDALKDFSDCNGRRSRPASAPT